MKKFGFVLVLLTMIFSSCHRNKAVSDETGSRYKGEYYGNRSKHQIKDAYGNHPYVGGGYAWER